jgi:hypothetical protein
MPNEYQARFIFKPWLFIGHPIPWRVAAYLLLLTVIASYTYCNTRLFLTIFPATTDGTPIPSYRKHSAMPLENPRPWRVITTGNNEVRNAALANDLIEYALIYTFTLSLARESLDYYRALSVLCPSIKYVLIAL